MYDAFITYSRKDSAFAAWLERRLERYRAPSGLSVERPRLNVFRDVQDLVGNELSHSIETAIRQSRKLVVVCSPRARDSEWVAKEIHSFATHHGASGIIPVLIDGRPNNEVIPDDPRQDQAFPDALLAHIAEPLAADFRTHTGEGIMARRERRQEALFQLLAALFDTEKEALLRRHLRRTRQLQALALTASLVLTVFFSWLVYSADQSAKEARRQQGIAVARRLAEEALASDDGTAFGLHLGALLGVESLRRHPTPAGVEAAEYTSRRLLRPDFEESVDQGAAIALSPDGEWLAAATGGPEGAFVHVWRRTVSSSEAVWILERPQEPSEIAVGEGGDRVAINEFDGGWQVHVFDLPSGRTIASFLAGSGPVSLCGAGRILAYVTPDGAIEVLELEGRNRLALLTPSDRISAFALDRDGRSLGILTFANTVEVWNLTTTSLARPRVSIEGIVGEQGEYRGQPFVDRFASALAADGYLVATGDAEGNVQIWDLRDQEEVQRALHGDRPVQNVALSANGTRVAAVSFHGSLRAWSLNLPRAVPGCDPGEWTSLKSAMSGDGNRIAFADTESVVVCDVARQREIARILHGQDPRSLALSRDGRWLATADGYEVTRVWDVDTGNERARIPTLAEHFGGLVGAVGVSADGRHIAVGGEFEIVGLLDADTGETLLHTRGSGGTVSSRGSTTFGLSGDGRHLVVGNESGFVDLWAVASQSVVGRLSLGSRVLAYGFGPNDDFLATYTADGYVRLWNMPELIELARIRLGPMKKTIGFTSSGRLIAVDDHGRRSDHLWDPSELIAEACARLLINMSPDRWRQHLGNEPYRPTCPNLGVPDESRRVGRAP